MFFCLNNFMDCVKGANPTFGRGIFSSLRSLIAVLKRDCHNPVEVRRALESLRTEKLEKYRDAIWYLEKTYPVLDRIPVIKGHTETTRAILYHETALPPNYSNGKGPHTVLRPDWEWLTEESVEQWLLTHGGNNVGIMTIHLSSFQEQEMSMVFVRRRVVDHMNSVLRIGRLCGCNLLCLHMEGDAVCRELAAAANKFGSRKTRVLLSSGHMGGHSETFRSFAKYHDYVVVMGFDANVCVRANLFGCPERFGPGQEGPFVPPLTSLTNVVTSRALLATTGVINPFPSYGGLENK